MIEVNSRLVRLVGAGIIGQTFGNFKMLVQRLALEMASRSLTVERAGFG